MRYGPKYIWFPAAYTLFGGAFLYSLYRVLYGGALLIQVQDLFFLMGALLLFGIAASLFFLFESSFKNLLVPHLIFAGMFAFLFRGDFGSYFWYYIAGLMIIMLFIILAWRRIQVERDERIHMQLRKILPRGLPMFFTALALLIALAYFFSSFSGTQKELQAFQVPQPLFNAVLGPLGDLVFAQIPLYRKGMSAEEFFLALDISQGINDPSQVSPEFLKRLEESNIPTGEEVGITTLLQDERFASLLQQEIARAAQDEARLEEVRTKYSEQFGVEVLPEDTIEDLLYKLVNVQLNNFQKSFGVVLPVAFAAGLFFTMKALSFPLMWIMILFTASVMKVLKATNVVSIEEVDTKKETFVIN